MKIWFYFYIEHTIRNREPFSTEPGWTLNHKSEYIILSDMLILKNL